MPDLTPRDLPADWGAYLSVVREEAYGRAPAGCDQLLAQDPDRWRRALVELVESATEQQVKLTAEWEGYRAQLRPPAAFAAKRAEVAEARGRTQHFKRKMDARLRHVNGLRGRNGSGTNPWRELCAWLVAVAPLDEADRRMLLADCPPHLAGLLALVAPPPVEVVIRADTSAFEAAAGGHGR